MNVRVLVFPSINEPGLEVVNALAKSNKVELLGGSSFGSDYDPSRLVLEQHLECPRLGHPTFRRDFEQLLLDNEIDVVFPTVDALIAEFASWKDVPARLVVSASETAELVLSKSRTYEALRDHVPVPEIFDGKDSVPLPAFAKPDIGSGSRGTMLVEDAETLALARKRRLLVHEYLPGAEYTVDCLCGLDGELLFASPRIRGQIARGISVGTTGVDDPQIAEAVRSIAAQLELRGPWFAQFKRAVDGTPTLIEVNARVSGSMGLTRLSGVNIPLISLFMFMGHQVTVPKFSPGLRINRSLRAVGEVHDFAWVIWDLDDTLVRKDGKVDPDVIARLYDFRNQGKQQAMLTRRQEPLDYLRDLGIPGQFFATVQSADDKPAALVRLLDHLGISPEECVIINDSVTENLVIQQVAPEVRTFMPDTIDMLQREKIR